MEVIARNNIKTRDTICASEEVVNIYIGGLSPARNVRALWFAGSLAETRWC
jgi:hypothetical protein